jgi:hypothetical protein
MVLGGYLDFPEVTAALAQEVQALYMVVGLAGLAILALAQFVLSGPVQPVNSHRQIQETYNA